MEKRRTRNSELEPAVGSREDPGTEPKQKGARACRLHGAEAHQDLCAALHPASHAREGSPRLCPCPFPRDHPPGVLGSTASPLLQRGHDPPLLWCQGRGINLEVPSVSYPRGCSSSGRDFKLGKMVLQHAGGHCQQAGEQRPKRTSLCTGWHGGPSTEQMPRDTHRSLLVPKATHASGWKLPLTPR